MDIYKSDLINHLDFIENLNLWNLARSSFCENKFVRKYRTSAVSLEKSISISSICNKNYTRMVWASHLVRWWSPFRSWFPSILCCTRSHIGWHHLHTCHWYKDLNCTRQYWRHSEDLRIRLGIYSDKVPGETRSEGSASS